MVFKELINTFNYDVDIVIMLNNKLFYKGTVGELNFKQYDKIKNYFVRINNPEYYGNKIPFEYVLIDI